MRACLSSGFPRRVATALSWLALWLGLAATAMAATGGIALKLDVSGKVIACDARADFDAARIARVLDEGTQVGVDWDIEVAAVRRYWLDATLAEVTVKRRVRPDLVSRSWLLMDETTGITRRVFDVREAVRFLVRLDHFPVLDRSLLEHARPYRMTVTARKTEGDAERGWLATWLGRGSLEASAAFSLP